MSEPLFLSDRIGREWSAGRLDGRLQSIFRAVVSYAAAFPWTPLITCIYRTPAENDALHGGHGDHPVGVHVLWRGIDVRTRDRDPAMVREITDWTNAQWIYDPARPRFLVAFLETTVVDESSGPHLHFQTSPATVPRPVESA